MFIIDWFKNLLHIGWDKTDRIVIGSVSVYGITIKGELKKMAILDDVQQILLAVEGRNKRNNASQVYDVPVWSTDTPEIFTLEPAADGLSCNAKAAGTLGDGRITCRAKVRQNEEIYRNVVHIIPVAASETETLVIVEGAITVQPEFA